MSCRVFYVDDQEDIVWSTTRLLARNCPDLEVESFTEPTAALEALKKHPPDILVTDLRMEGMSGLELMVEARKVVADLPVIVVTAYGGPGLTAALLGRSMVEYLEKPIRTELLVASIDRLLVRGEGFSGAISLPMLPDLVQVYTLSQTTGALAIRRGTSSGTIWFDKGQIVHAVCGHRSGEAAVYELLSWQGGEFSLDTKTRATEKTITASWQEVLLEGCRLLDEGDRGSTIFDDLEDAEEEFPSSQVQVPIDLTPTPQVSDSENANNFTSPLEASQPSADLSTTDFPQSTPSPTGHLSVDPEHLALLSKLDGFICAAVFDGSIRSFVCAEGQPTADELETTVVDNANALLEIHQTMRDLNLEDSVTDVVFTLSGQYHLIRPLNRRGAGFLCLVLDRKQGDLKGARVRLVETEERLEAEHSPIPASQSGIESTSATASSLK